MAQEMASEYWLQRAHLRRSCWACVPHCIPRHWAGCDQAWEREAHKLLRCLSRGEREQITISQRYISFIHSFIHLFVHLFIHSLLYSFLNPLSTNVEYTPHNTVVTSDSCNSGHVENYEKNWHFRRRAWNFLQNGIQNFSKIPEKLCYKFSIFFKKKSPKKALVLKGLILMFFFTIQM